MTRLCRVLSRVGISYPAFDSLLLMSGLCEPSGEVREDCDWLSKRPLAIFDSDFIDSVSDSAHDLFNSAMNWNFDFPKLKKIFRKVPWSAHALPRPWWPSVQRHIILSVYSPALLLANRFPLQVSVPRLFSHYRNKNWDWNPNRVISLGGGQKIWSPLTFKSY